MVKTYTFLEGEQQFKRQYDDPRIESRTVKKCVNPITAHSFPCIIGQSVFENANEYIEFVKADKLRRSGKTHSQHYDSIAKMLQEENPELPPLKRKIHHSKSTTTGK